MGSLFLCRIVLKRQKSSWNEKFRVEQNVSSICVKNGSQRGSRGNVFPLCGYIKSVRLL